MTEQIVSEVVEVPAQTVIQEEIKPTDAATSTPKDVTQPKQRRSRERRESRRRQPRRKADEVNV